MKPKDEAKSKDSAPLISSFDLSSFSVETLKGWNVQKIILLSLNTPDEI